MSSPSSETEANPVAESPLGDDTLAAEPQAQLAAAQERWLRLAADFENYKKRAARDRDEARRNGAESVISRLLPVLDNFDMAMSAAAQPNTTLENLRVGVTMIHGQFRNLLSEVGIKELESVGQPFDPTLHEAVSMEPSAAVPEGYVAQQTRKGYRLGDRLLRPASVIVASRPVADTKPS